nr:hypothetical protein [Tanacetum cinerariifolium]
MTTRVTSFDQPPLQIMHMLYYFVNNIHVDYADLLWEGLHYSHEHPSTLIPYPRFTKLIVSYYMTVFSEISRRAHDRYHNLDDDMMVKNIFNLGKHKDGVGMKILSRMITDEMKLTKNYQLYAVVFETINSTYTTNTIPNYCRGDDIILKDTIKLSLAEQKSRDELEAKKNVQKVKEHLIAKEIEKLVKGAENVEDDKSTLKQDDTQYIPGTRLEPRSNKESPEISITVVEQPVNVTEKEEESAEDDYELRRKKGSI